MPPVLRLLHEPLLLGRPVAVDVRGHRAEATLARLGRSAMGTSGSGGDRRPHERWLALYVLCAGMLMIVLDATIVNVALPSIQDDLGFSQSNLAWVVNAYLIAFGGLLLLAGRLGDLIGQRRIFLIGLGGLHRRLAAVRRRPEPGHADRRRASSRASAAR